MSVSISLAGLLERFFTQRLMQQRQASPHTISSYSVTVQVGLSISLDKSRRIVYCMLDECDSGKAARQTTRGSGEPSSALEPSQPRRSAATA